MRLRSTSSACVSPYAAATSAGGGRDERGSDVEARLAQLEATPRNILSSDTASRSSQASACCGYTG